MLSTGTNFLPIEIQQYKLIFGRKMSPSGNPPLEADTYAHKMIFKVVDILIKWSVNFNVYNKLTLYNYTCT